MSALPAPPPSLKHLSPYLQRHAELLKADPCMSYYCLYYAAQQGIAASAAQDAEGKAFLVSLLDKLEELKASLSWNDAVHNDEAGSAYIENFALKVFTSADNEDRAGRASRNTARSFLAAANFFDILSIFGATSEEATEKKTYAKWKAAEIAKALKEGRKPAPGPPGWDAEQERREREEEEAVEKAVETARDDDDLLAREIARLTAPNQQPSDEVIGRALSPDSTAGTEQSDRRAPARLSLDAASMLNGSDLEALGAGSRQGSDRPFTPPPQSQGGDLPGLASPNFSHPLRPQLTRGFSSSLSNDGSLKASSSLHTPPDEGQNVVDRGLGPSSASRTFLGVPQSTSHHSSVNTSWASPSATPGEVTVPGRPLPVPPGGDAAAVTSLGKHSPALGDPSRPNTVAHSPHNVFSPTPLAPSLPFPASPAVAPAMPPSAPQITTDDVPLPTTLTSKQTSAAQRLAKFAISALDYEDLDTARRHLREALDIVEGRSPAA
ncbi:unnamed protein product [Parajaminaea phylloscopi]